MSKIFHIIYFTLLTITIVKSNDMLDEEPNEDDVIKISKHHLHKTKSTLDSEVPETVANGKNETNIASQTDIDEENDEDVSDIERSAHPKVLAPRSDDKSVNEQSPEEPMPRTLFVGNLNRKLVTSNQPDHENANDDDDFAIKSNNNLGATDEPDEILIYTPNKETLSPNVILDLKARTGYIGSEESLKENSKSSYEKEFSPNVQSNTNRRSGYIPQDYIDDIYLNVEDTTSPLNSILRYKNGQLWLDQVNTRPTEAPVYPSNSYPSQKSYPNPFINYVTNNNKEVIHPNPNHHEVKWDPINFNRHDSVKRGFGLQTQYYGNAFQNMLQQNSNNRCLKCQYPSLRSYTDHNFRRSTDNIGVKSSSVEHNNPGTFLTANGRSLDYDPVGTNAYPFISEINEEPEDVKRVQEALPRNNFRNIELFAKESRESGRNLQPYPYSKEVSPPSKISFPSYHPPISTLLNRLGLDVDFRRITG